MRYIYMYITIREALFGSSRTPQRLGPIRSRLMWNIRDVWAELGRWRHRISGEDSPNKTIEYGCPCWLCSSNGTYFELLSWTIPTIDRMFDPGMRGQQPPLTPAKPQVATCVLMCTKRSAREEQIRPCGINATVIWLTNSNVNVSC